MKGDEGNGAHRVTSRGVTSRRRPGTRPARRSRSRFRGLAAGGVGVVLASAALAACGTSSASTGPVSLSFYLYPDNSGATQTAIKNCDAQSGGKYTISYQELPNASDGQRQQLVRRLAARDSTIDIMGLDVTWEAEFSEAGWLVPRHGTYKAQAENGTLKPALATAMWHNQLVAVPDNSNTQLLWYRSDLVPNPPKTWAEMLADAAQLKKEGKPHYIEIQGAQYEGATVWFNTMVACASIVATIDAMRDEEIIENAARIGTQVLGPGLRELAERHPVIGEVRGLAVFWALDLVSDRQTRAMLAPYGGSSQAMQTLVAECRARGLMPFVNYNRLHVVPPCTVSEAEAKEGLAILDDFFAVVDRYYEG